MFRDANLEEALITLGQLLRDRGETYDVVVIGGGALLLLGLIERPTKDLDAVARVQDGRWLRAEPFPDGLARAVADVADALDLADDWLNPGPAGLLTREALVAAARWCRTHDPSSGFRDMLLLPVLAELGVEDPDV